MIPETGGSRHRGRRDRRMTLSQMTLCIGGDPVQPLPDTVEFRAQVRG